MPNKLSLSQTELKYAWIVGFGKDGVSTLERVWPNCSTSLCLFFYAFNSHPLCPVEAPLQLLGNFVL